MCFSSSVVVNPELLLRYQGFLLVMQIVRSSILFILHIFIGFQLELGCVIFAPIERLDDVAAPAWLNVTRKSLSVSRGRPGGKAVIRQNMKQTYFVNNKNEFILADNDWIS